MKKIAVLFLFSVFLFSFLSYWVFSDDDEVPSETIFSSCKKKLSQKGADKSAAIKECRDLVEKTRKILNTAVALQKRNHARALANRYAAIGHGDLPDDYPDELYLYDFKEGRKGLEDLANIFNTSESLHEKLDKIKDNTFTDALQKMGALSLNQEIRDKTDEIKKTSQFGQEKERILLKERLDALKLRKEVLPLVLEAENPDLEKSYDELPGIDDLEEEARREEQFAKEIYETKKREKLSVVGSRDLLASLREGKASPSASEITVSCPAPPQATTGWGESLYSLFIDKPSKAIGWVGGKLSGVPEGLVSIDEALTQYGGPAKLGLFSTFSALAQYQYTRKGSKNSQTQIFRAVAIALGSDMGIKGQLPRGLEGAIDPLKPFKREPLSLQQRLDSQEKILNTVLTIGGDPSIPGGFPAGTHEQLQRILKGSVLPGGIPDFSAPPGFPGIYDPSFVNFSRQAFNGFPPFPTTQTRGALLNPGFASDNPFSRGSTAASGNFKTLSHGDGVATVGNVASATAVLTAGVRDFSTQLEEINPQDNSLKSLIDDIPLRESRGITLQKSKNELAALLSNPRESFLQNLQQEQATLIIQKQNEIAQLNKELFDATLEFRRRDFYVQPDEDGLMPAGAKDFSKNFERRTEALLRLQELTRKRAGAIEGLALVRGNLPLFKRLQQGGQLPTGSSLLQPTPPLAPLGFAIRPLWAVEKVVPPKFVPNWRAMVREEIQKIDRDMENNRKTLGNNLSQLRSLVLLDPDGVHEINAEVVQREKFNLKALAWQARDNLGKLERAASDIAIDIKTRSDLESYKAAFSKLEKAAHTGANELARVERLQREKMERSDLFDYYQEFGKEIVAKYFQ